MSSACPQHITQKIILDEVTGTLAHLQILEAENASQKTTLNRKD